ncbi:hypothetical protein A2U01_0093332, partial [Trifolium medium]|nr:hypothetical protein [Trifolium medium]
MDEDWREFLKTYKPHELALMRLPPMKTMER